MKFNEMKISEIKPGLRFHGLKNKEKLGTVLFIDYMDDSGIYYRWDDEKWEGVLYGNCECEIAQNEDGTVLINSGLLNKDDRYRQRTSEEALLKYFEKAKLNQTNKLYGLKVPKDASEKLQTILKALD